ncbi:hypothetical protein SAMN05216421_3131 [Halopseudomonas xinjiangensis]|uniref:DUF1318 domain-containing protein n=1 Tax=Halopseudomonas xinjiangensis TaxID=487184 RepID=A0A1H1YEK5_9GAMM|nr:YdbL family protein [Halopseudomonas xinjiangensis]SDT19811.1 hypothetical protein SAMN05216421_3131 [Halopseudomonas xinjiangensis]
MRMTFRIGGLLLALLLSVSAWAMTLNEAMTALPAAKAAGQLGEKPDGYLGVVAPGGNATAAQIAEQINRARRAEYQRLAKDNGIQQADVESIAGKKAIERTANGQYIMLNGVWMKK